jgi:hypothetical protein
MLVRVIAQNQRKCIDQAMKHPASPAFKLDELKELLPFKVERDVPLLALQL